MNNVRRPEKRTSTLALVHLRSYHGDIAFENLAKIVPIEQVFVADWIALCHLPDEDTIARVQQCTSVSGIHL